MYENYEKYDMLRCFLESGEVEENAGELYFQRYPERRQPHQGIFRKLKNNLIRYGSFMKPRSKTYDRREVDRELEEIVVLGEIQNNSNLSTRQMERQTLIPRTSIMRVLHKHRFRPYRIRKIHQLRPPDINQRITFCQWFLEKCRENAEFPTHIIWTDEACVSSAGIFNRYNVYNWTRENPHLTVEQVNQGRFSFSVWIGIIGGRFVGPHIFDGTLTSVKYLEILQQYIDPFIDDLPLILRPGVMFQQDGAPPHNANIIGTYLTDLMGENWIGNRGPIHWPARSPDLTPPDFFLWGRIKNLTFQERPNSRQDLEAALLHAFNLVSPVELLNTVNSVRKRCRLCLQQNGAQFEHLM